ncbi:hypothetical protein C1645_880202 [Glomus cerebriforme]|uniref:Uncharacterized protein n=1 Tax=Glomus cerebriforme TaxID=658196 RepID=A0A397SGZ8_9GLOM|nr:hypothetical protein C1645_880202 [Glomus cerebriforme]
MSQHVILNKNEVKSEEFYGEIILIIEYNAQGLATRQIIEAVVAQTIRNTVGYKQNPLPNVLHQPQSDLVFVFSKMTCLYSEVPL